MTTLGELAKTLELELRGDATRPIAGLAALESATEADLSFVSEKKHLSKASDTNAGALILHPDWVDAWSGCALLSDAPYVAFARATRIFDNHPPCSGQIHEQAAVADSALLGTDVTIDAGACVEANAVLGDRVWIGAGRLYWSWCEHRCRYGNQARCGDLSRGENWRAMRNSPQCDDRCGWLWLRAQRRGLGKN